MRKISPIFCLLFSVSFAFSGCGKSETTKKEPAPAVPDTKPSDAAKTPATKAPADAGVREQMQEHYAAIRTIERAIVIGDKATARSQAQALAEHTPTKGVTEYAEEIEAVKAAALSLSKEESIEGLAKGAAELASLCGHCHLVTTRITSFEWTEPPAEDGSAMDRMQRHLWAMDRLWEGLVGPSEMSWDEGSKVLGVNPFPVDKLPVDAEFQAEAKKQLAAIADLAKQASKAKELADRSKVYGALLETCSGCHTKLR